jgi:hypothetical protein
VKIPYSELPTKPNAAFPQRSAIDRPIVALLLSRGDRSILAYAFVDSGADSCVFPASIGAALGIAIPNQHPATFSGTLDSSQVAYFDEIQATVLPLESAEITADQEPITFPLYAGFCETLEHVGMGLLGHEGFFSRFEIRFCASQRYFEIL